jgi:uncharacterized membrane protein YidH (DUF202 family)
MRLLNCSGIATPVERELVLTAITGSISVDCCLAKPMQEKAMAEEEEEHKEKDDYAPYLTPIWGYLALFLIIVPIVLILGRKFGR